MQVKFEDIDPESRIWIYQANRELSPAEAAEIEREADNFIPGWTAHSKDLKAAARLFHNRFLVLAVDEKHRGASGCSIDKSVDFIKQLEMRVHVNFFDRLSISYKDGERVKTFALADFRKLWDEGKLSEETMVFNNIISSKSELENKWLQPLGKSWLSKKIPA